MAGILKLSVSEVQISRGGAGYVLLTVDEIMPQKAKLKLFNGALKPTVQPGKEPRIEVSIVFDQFVNITASDITKQLVQDFINLCFSLSCRLFSPPTRTGKHDGLPGIPCPCLTCFHSRASETCW